MNFSFNRILIKFFSINILLLGLFVFNVNTFYAEDILYTEGDFQYYVRDDMIEIVKYIGEDSEVHVPYNISTYEVRSIESGAFDDTPVEKVYIYDNVKYSGEEGSGTNIELITTDVSDVEIPDTKNHDNPVSEDKSETTSDSNDDNIEFSDDGSGFESDSIDIADELAANSEENDQEEEHNEKSNNIVSGRISHLFDGSIFSSKHEKDNTGYVIIGISLVLIIVIFIFFFKKYRIKK